MDIRRNAHMTAASELLEVMSIASSVAIIADCIWVMSDIVVDGLTMSNGVVVTLLFTACFFMVRATIHYHNRSVKAKVRETLQIELKNARTKYKRNKNKGR